MAAPGPDPLPIEILATTARPQRRRRILVLKLDHYGDFIIGLPALEQLRRTFPGDLIRLVCGPWNEASARLSGLFDEIRCYRYFPENAIGWSGRPVDDSAVFRAAVEGHFDVAVDLRVDPDTRLLLADVEADLRCGIGSRGTFPFLQLALPKAVRGNALETWEARLFGPDRFRSQMPIHKGFHDETDFSVSNRYMMDGLDLALPRGRYRATFGLRMLGPLQGLGASVLIEIVRGGLHLAAHKTLKRRRQIRLHGPPVLGFDNADDGAHFEFRLHTGGRSPGSRLRFSGLYLEAFDEHGAPHRRARLHPAELHVGEQLSLLVGLLAERVRPLFPQGVLPQAGAPPAVLADVPADRRIVIAPFSNSAVRTWPAVHFASLISTLLAIPGRVVLLTGSASQTMEVEAIRTATADPSRVFNLAGRLLWQELPAVLRSADLVICNNSGTAHLAGASGARTLAIYSGSHPPREWGPRGPSVTTLMARVPCSPCGYERLEDCVAGHLCMRGLTPDIVAGQAEEMLAIS